MKTIAIHLRLATASHRKRMMGIFRHFGSTDNWELRILPDEDHLSATLRSSDPSVVPDGIISGIPHTDEARKLIAESAVPFVGIGMTAENIGLPLKKAAFVVNDNFGIGKAAAAFFLNLGSFRSFAFIPDELDRSWSAERGKAFGDELAAHGKSCTFYTGGKKGSAGEKALAQFLNGLEKPAAVFAAWDGRAADALHAARVARLRVPEEISVLGVDDDKLICEQTRPALSSIRTDAEGMGEEAARLLAGMIRSGRTTLRKPITRPILNIIERDSTRTPAAWRLRGANPPGGGENRRRPPFQILEEISGADERDLSALTSLLDPSAEFDAASLRQSMRDGSATVFVKRTRGRIVAAAAIARFSTPTGTHHRIEDVIVHPTLRGKGIGKKMMTHLLDHLRSRQAKSVELTSRPSRVAANALYRSLGFAQRETNVYEYRFGLD